MTSYSIKNCLSTTEKRRILFIFFIKHVRKTTKTSHTFAYHFFLLTFISDKSIKRKLVMLSIVLPVKNFFRIGIPVLCLFGCAPTFFIFWFFLRLITAIFFSEQIYRRFDDILYSLYQQFVLFFFENWVNVKVLFVQIKVLLVNVLLI